MLETSIVKSLAFCSMLKAEHNVSLSSKQFCNLGACLHTLTELRESIPGKITCVTKRYQLAMYYWHVILIVSCIDTVQ